VQNFEIQFLKEAAKFVGDFKSLAKEADASLAKHKILELEIERLLKAVVSQDIISVVQNASIVDTSDLQTELEPYKDMQQKIERLQAQLGDLKGKCKETSCVSDTQNQVFQKLENVNVELEFQNTKFAKQPNVEILSKIGKTNALLKPVTYNSVSKPQVSKGVNNAKVIAPGMFRISLDKVFREAKKMPNTVIQIFLWCVDSGCSKHMTGNLKLLINFVWKFMGTVHFRNDHVAAILGFGDLQWGNILITGVYFVEGLGHNLFSVGQFCDSDLEVAFRRNACFVRNLEGVDLLKGDRSTNLYTINLHEMASASPICLMARASSTKSRLWHQRLSHLNFDTINDLARNDLVAVLLKFKYHKE
nr:retrovirus-related Pol polyprotein from transposon TNT 1-94 [Tanacetum cinerariifolium]